MKILNIKHRRKLWAALVAIVLIIPILLVLLPAAALYDGQEVTLEWHASLYQRYRKPTQSESDAYGGIFNELVGHGIMGNYYSIAADGTHYVTYCIDPGTSPISGGHILADNIRHGSLDAKQKIMLSYVLGHGQQNYKQDNYDDAEGILRTATQVACWMIGMRVYNNTAALDYLVPADGVSGNPFAVQPEVTRKARELLDGGLAAASMENVNLGLRTMTWVEGGTPYPQFRATFNNPNIGAWLNNTALESKINAAGFTITNRNSGSMTLQGVPNGYPTTTTASIHETYNLGLEFMASYFCVIGKNEELQNMVTISHNETHNATFDLQLEVPVPNLEVQKRVSDPAYTGDTSFKDLFRITVTGDINDKTQKYVYFQDGKSGTGATRNDPAGLDTFVKIPNPVFGDTYTVTEAVWRDGDWRNITTYPIYRNAVSGTRTVSPSTEGKITVDNNATHLKVTKVLEPGTTQDYTSDIFRIEVTPASRSAFAPGSSSPKSYFFSATGTGNGLDKTTPAAFGTLVEVPDVMIGHTYEATEYVTRLSTGVETPTGRLYKATVSKSGSTAYNSQQIITVSNSAPHLELTKNVLPRGSEYTDTDIIHIQLKGIFIDPDGEKDHKDFYIRPRESGSSPAKYTGANTAADPYNPGVPIDVQGVLYNQEYEIIESVIRGTIDYPINDSNLMYRQGAITVSGTTLTPDKKFTIPDAANALIPTKVTVAIANSTPLLELNKVATLRGSEYDTSDIVHIRISGDFIDDSTIAPRPAFHDYYFKSAANTNPNLTYNNGTIDPAFLHNFSPAGTDTNKFVVKGALFDTEYTVTETIIRGGIEYAGDDATSLYGPIVKTPAAPFTISEPIIPGTQPVAGTVKIEIANETPLLTLLKVFDTKGSEYLPDDIIHIRLYGDYIDTNGKKTNSYHDYYIQAGTAVTDKYTDKDGNPNQPIPNHTTTPESKQLYARGEVIIVEGVQFGKTYRIEETVIRRISATEFKEYSVADSKKLYNLDPEKDITTNPTLAKENPSSVKVDVGANASVAVEIKNETPLLQLVKNFTLADGEYAETDIIHIRLTGRFIDTNGDKGATGYHDYFIKAPGSTVGDSITYTANAVYGGGSQPAPNSNTTPQSAPYVSKIYAADETITVQGAMFDEIYTITETVIRGRDGTYVEYSEADSHKMYALDDMTIVPAAGDVSTGTGDAKVYKVKVNPGTQNSVMITVHNTTPKLELIKTFERVGDQYKQTDIVHIVLHGRFIDDNNGNGANGALLEKSEKHYYFRATPGTWGTSTYAPIGSTTESVAIPDPRYPETELYNPDTLVNVLGVLFDTNYTVSETVIRFVQDEITPNGRWQEFEDEVLYHFDVYNTVKGQNVPASPVPLKNNLLNIPHPTELTATTNKIAVSGKITMVNTPRPELYVNKVVARTVPAEYSPVFVINVTGKFAVSEIDENIYINNINNINNKKEDGITWNYPGQYGRDPIPHFYDDQWWNGTKVERTEKFYFTVNGEYVELKDANDNIIYEGNTYLWGAVGDILAAANQTAGDKAYVPHTVYEEEYEITEDVIWHRNDNAGGAWELHPAKDFYKMTMTGDDVTTVVDGNGTKVSSEGHNAVATDGAKYVVKPQMPTKGNGVAYPVYDHVRNAAREYDAALRKWISKIEPKLGGTLPATGEFPEPENGVFIPMPWVVRGDTIEFKVKVYNQSAYDTIVTEVTDYVPVGFTFDPSDPQNAYWSIEDFRDEWTALSDGSYKPKSDNKTNGNGGTDGAARIKYAWALNNDLDHVLAPHLDYEGEWGTEAGESKSYTGVDANGNYQYTTLTIRLKIGTAVKSNMHIINFAEITDMTDGFRQGGTGKGFPVIDKDSYADNSFDNDGTIKKANRDNDGTFWVKEEGVEPLVIYDENDPEYDANDPDKLGKPANPEFGAPLDNNTVEDNEIEEHRFVKDVTKSDTPADGSSTSGKAANKEEDDHDVAGVYVTAYDVALRKWIAEVRRSKGEAPVYQWYNEGGSLNDIYTIDAPEEQVDLIETHSDDVVIFAIRVYNQSENPLYVTSIVDYLPEGMSFNPYDVRNIGWTIDRATGKMTYNRVAGLKSNRLNDVLYRHVPPQKSDPSKADMYLDEKMGAAYYELPYETEQFVTVILALTVNKDIVDNTPIINGAEVGGIAANLPDYTNGINPDPSKQERTFRPVEDVDSTADDSIRVPVEPTTKMPPQDENGYYVFNFGNGTYVIDPLTGHNPNAIPPQEQPEESTAADNTIEQHGVYRDNYVAPITSVGPQKFKAPGLRLLETVNDDMKADDNPDDSGKRWDDVDDHDVAGIYVRVFDAAQIHWISETRRGPYTPFKLDGEPDNGIASEVVPLHHDDRVTFKIKVMNQGENDIMITELTDYMPNYYVFEPEFNLPGWKDNGDGTLTYTLDKSNAEDPLNKVLSKHIEPQHLRMYEYPNEYLKPYSYHYPSSEYTIVELKLRVTSAAHYTTIYVNETEISAMEGEYPDYPAGWMSVEKDGETDVKWVSVYDVDSTPDNAKANDGAIRDNEREQHVHPLKSNVNNNDEDDHDISRMTLEYQPPEKTTEPPPSETPPNENPPGSETPPPSETPTLTITSTPNITTTTPTVTATPNIRVPETTPPPGDYESYEVFDEDGTPLGRWVWSEPDQEWIFEEYVPLAATGDSPTLLIWSGIAVAAALVAVVTRKRRKKAD
ncbi:MAG: LPXTG cell wall anchor domain-containing protein [Oscillospiraceae bacterium]|jgi:LPXTG-motif cell wall-anchored protein/uncharacterized repeat protein (TIGR01451 family)|nr:LPXTG cell wall anchor domain-containing protein [Oscillospiraceae bacterium]